MDSTTVLALDVGDKRIGMAIADDKTKIPRLLPTIDVTDQILEQIGELVTYEGIDRIVVGYPRNLSGEPTEQTAKVTSFVGQINQAIVTPTVYQDESLTSVRAEEILRSRGRPYTKSDIDAESAALILHDYLERL